AGSVGGQALTGIAALERLRHRTGAEIWPFETLGEGGAHVLAEIYPSLIEPEPLVESASGQEVKDARQVRAVATAFERLDAQGTLARHLRAPRDLPLAVRTEEATILGMHDPKSFQAAARAASVTGG
ncbi:MAG: precorrin-8X methylmutase, partial [Gammaproteobacteria bacterium]|nr:precorrin-8X methylmutase [Gammaproteobacteria bacterium]